MNEFGEYLKQIRGKRSLREMERITGLSHTYLSTLEKGYDPRSNKARQPTPEVLRKLSEGLSDGDENSTKEIYTSLMNYLGYVEEQTPIEKVVSEYINLTQFIEGIVSSYKSSQIHIHSQNEVLNNTKLSDGQIEEITKNVSFHEARLNDGTLQTALNRKNELESLIENEIQYRKNKVNELLKSIDYQN